MTTLIAGLIELARGGEHPSEPEDVRLDLARRRTPSSGPAAHRPGVTLRHRPRATRSCTASRRRSSGRSRNLLDNAAKWSPPGGEVEVGVANGTVVGARPRAGYRPRRTCLSCSTASTARARRARCRAPGWGSRSSGRSPRRTAAPSRPSTPRAAARGDPAPAVPPDRAVRRGSRHRRFLRPFQRRLRAGSGAAGLLGHVAITQPRRQSCSQATGRSSSL